MESMERRSSRPLDLDKLIARADPRLVSCAAREEGAARVKKWLDLADRMLDADLQQVGVSHRLRSGSL